MKDLFGNEINMTEFNNTRSPYQAFKHRNNYRKSFEQNTCGNCKHSQRWEYHNKYYWKCELLGFSNSEASDIRKGHICDKWAA